MANDTHSHRRKRRRRRRVKRPGATPVKPPNYRHPVEDALIAEMLRDLKQRRDKVRVLQKRAGFVLPLFPGDSRQLDD